MEKFEPQGLRGKKRQDVMAVREFRRQAVGDYDFQLQTPDLRRQERRGEDAPPPTISIRSHSSSCQDYEGAFLLSYSPNGNKHPQPSAYNLDAAGLTWHPIVVTTMKGFSSCAKFLEL